VNDAHVQEHVDDAHVQVHVDDAHVHVHVDVGVDVDVYVNVPIAPNMDDVDVGVVDTLYEGGCG
jgi:hypothetical protein